MIIGIAGKGASMIEGSLTVSDVQDSYNCEYSIESHTHTHTFSTHKHIQPHTYTHIHRILGKDNVVGQSCIGIFVLVCVCL